MTPWMSPNGIHNFGLIRYIYIIIISLLFLISTDIVLSFCFCFTATMRAFCLVVICLATSLSYDVHGLLRTKPRAALRHHNSFRSSSLPRLSSSFGSRPCRGLDPSQFSSFLLARGNQRSSDFDQNVDDTSFRLFRKVSSFDMPNRFFRKRHLANILLGGLFLWRFGGFLKGTSIAHASSLMSKAKVSAVKGGKGSVRNNKMNPRTLVTGTGVVLVAAATGTVVARKLNIDSERSDSDQEDRFLIREFSPVVPPDESPMIREDFARVRAADQRERETISEAQKIANGILKDMKNGIDKVSTVSDSSRSKEFLDSLGDEGMAKIEPRKMVEKMLAQVDAAQRKALQIRTADDEEEKNDVESETIFSVPSSLPSTLLDKAKPEERSVPWSSPSSTSDPSTRDQTPSPVSNRESFEQSNSAPGLGLGAKVTTSDPKPLIESPTPRPAASPAKVEPKIKDAFLEKSSNVEGIKSDTNLSVVPKSDPPQLPDAAIRALSDAEAPAAEPKPPVPSPPDKAATPPAEAQSSLKTGFLGQFAIPSTRASSSANKLPSATAPVRRDKTSFLPFQSGRNAYEQVRKQPKDPAEEAALKAKYGSISNLGDRAYQILRDLGMLENND